jgi:hypothetical protein
VVKVDADSSAEAKNSFVDEVEDCNEQSELARVFDFGFGNHNTDEFFEF